MKHSKMDAQLVDYPRLISDLKAILSMEKLWGKRALTYIKIQIIWRVGERISQEFQAQSEGKVYGNALYSELAKDLNISKSFLFAAVKFFLSYPFPQHISPELTWNHYKLLISIDQSPIRRFYETQAISNNWTIRELKKRIQSKEHKRIEKSQVSLPSAFIPIPEITEVIKSSYNFDFVQLPENYTERDLERNLINNIGKFLLELGSGFFFGGNQYKITISGNSHYVDLVFFHINLACYVLIDLKIEKFSDRFIGQMNKYLRYFRERINLPYMRPPIGILLCKSLDAEEVYFALENLEKKIFVSEYQLFLPTEKQFVHLLQGDAKTHLASARKSKRQIRALKKLESSSSFQVKDYQKAAKISLSTAQRDLQNLVKEGVLIREGGGKNTCYIFRHRV